MSYREDSEAQRRIGMRRARAHSPLLRALTLRTAALRARGGSRVLALGLLLALVLALLLLSGCTSGLWPKPSAPVKLLSIDDATNRADSADHTDAPVMASPTSALTLLVMPPRAAPGLDTRDIAWLRRPHEIEYYALHQWVDTPGHLLAPLIVRSLQRSGMFRAVVSAPSSAATDLRLETELLKLQQDFSDSPSRVRLSLRATLVDTATRRLLATLDLEAVTVAPSEDAEGGAAAASLATREVLRRLDAFCASAVAR
jgi:cholesterol transport system auxiliary component